MTDEREILNQLVAMSRSLGDPARGLVILGEGNTSARADEKTFFVKASGKELGTADENSFVRVSLPRVIEGMNSDSLTDEEVKETLVESKVDRSTAAMPSLEAFLHACLLSLPDIRFVGHTHPTAVNAILCSIHSREAVSGRLFPDEIVCCGPAVCYVEYTDPGLALARHLRKRVKEFMDDHNMAPRVILMENHGMIACGRTTRDVETITSMAVKTAEILLGTYALGGPRFLSPENVARIHARPDEVYRQKKLGMSS
ncbi:MAG: class II aldolase [Deltaproteobacteria bacterium]|nr:MAG: class II aldolase [Deltaproteobacteria bacterium]